MSAAQTRLSTFDDDVEHLMEASDAPAAAHGAGFRPLPVPPFFRAAANPPTARSFLGTDQPDDPRRRLNVLQDPVSMRCMMFRVGSMVIEKVHEMDLNGMTLRQLMPAFDPRTFALHPEWLPAGTSDEVGHACLSLHSWVVRHEGRTMLIDTGAGNHKSRPQQPVLDHLDNPFLERLNAAEVAPEDVDVVLHTHIHSDHVGWNTRLGNGRWVPTFPNAEIICSDLEWRYGAALVGDDEAGIARCRQQAGLGEPIRIPVAGTFADSMRPLDGVVPIRRIPIDGTEVLPGIRFLPTPGHSICHAAIEIVSGGEVALFSGDVFHHAAEIYAPELVSMFCEYPEAARQSRRFFLDRAAATQAMVFTAHFPRSSAGRIARVNDGYAWEFADPLPS